MSESCETPGKDQQGCCSFEFPDIPGPWLLFIEFAFTFGTTVIYFADIVTDIITLNMYFERGWYYAFGLSIFFIVFPSVLVAVMEFNFLRKTYGKSVPWKTTTLRTVLNIPFQLTVIWYHFRLTYTYFRDWLDHIRGIERKQTSQSTATWYDPTTLERSRGASLSSLNELEFYSRTADAEAENDDSASAVPLHGGRVLSQSMESLAIIDDDNETSQKEKSTWWKRLTREEWLSHLNRLKLSESMLESLPQLLINLYLIIRFRDTAVIQYVSAVLSYLSLCGGVVRYDKTRKDNEAYLWMVDKTLLHSRAFYTRLEWPQLLFISIYKASFIAARILSFVYFTIYFSWYILVPVLVHWATFLAYLVYKWFPDFSKVTKQLRQADYKYRAYMLLSRDFTSVFHASLMGIFIHVRPYYHAFLDQPYCFMLWYYLVYVSENIVLFLLPGIVKTMEGSDSQLELYRYYPLLATELFLNILGCVFCATYYLSVHKMRPYTAHAYPFASKTLCCFCYWRQSKEGYSEWLPVRREWTVCKQAETSELFFLTKEQLKSFQQTYNTIVRNDRHKGRAVECFIDDRCRIFYAPRSKMKKLSLKTFNDATLRPSYRMRLKDTHGRAATSRDAERAILVQENGEPSNVGDELDGCSRVMDAGDDLVQTHVSVESYQGDDPHPVMEQPSNISPKIERPVKKPRVKSLLHGKPVVTSSDVTETMQPKNETDDQLYDEESASTPGHDNSAASTRLPRSIDQTPDSLSDMPEQEERSSQRKKKPMWLKKPETSLPPVERLKRETTVQQRSPRRIDDAIRTSSNRVKIPDLPKLVDDSTYRVPKGSDSDKNLKRKVAFQAPDSSDEKKAEHFHPAGELVEGSSDWTQTWI